MKRDLEEKRIIMIIFNELRSLYSNDDESSGGEEDNDDDLEIPFMISILCTAMMTRALEERRTMMRAWDSFHELHSLYSNDDESSGGEEDNDDDHEMAEEEEEDTKELCIQV